MSFFEREHKAEVSDEELSYWLAFSCLSGPGIGFRKLRALLDRFDSLEEIWLAKEAYLKSLRVVSDSAVEKFAQARREIEPLNLLERVRKSGARALHYFHPSYPALLRHIYDPPLVLYMKGNLQPEDIKHTIGVVGTRRPTSYGQRIAKDIARELAHHGVTVVSGMAVGVDSLAHWGAIEGEGRTIAVLACGVDICYPSSNKPLYSALLEGGHGAVVSEFFPGTKPDKWRFPARNRIISGLSDSLLVVEAGDASGALITAEMAWDQGREVYAIPGRIDSPMSIGTNRLISTCKAKLVTSCQDILAEKDWVAKMESGASVPTVVELFGRERELFEMISTEPVQFDYLAEKTGMNSGELSASLTMLELAGVISRLPGDWYARVEAIASV